MLLQLLVALVLAMATVAIHGAGTAWLVRTAWRREFADFERRNAGVSMAILTRLVAALLMLHLAEMTIWAVAYRMAGVFPEFETSLYYSLKSYTTVGYGDVLPSKPWRLLGPIEAAVGVLMLGWSTGIIVAAVQRIHALSSANRD